MSQSKGAAKAKMWNIVAFGGTVNTCQWKSPSCLLVALLPLGSRVGNLGSIHHAGSRMFPHLAVLEQALCVDCYSNGS